MMKKAMKRPSEKEARLLPTMDIPGKLFLKHFFRREAKIYLLIRLKWK
jgi:hypothetical protein